jgi:hypothetical protein
MNENLFNIITLLIPVLATIITGFVVPLIKAKINDEQLATIVKWVTYAVKCAEMIFTAEKQGVEKKAYVIDFINGLFNKKKTVITKEQIEVLIESAVKELNDSKVIVSNK